MKDKNKQESPTLPNNFMGRKPADAKAPRGGAMPVQGHNRGRQGRG